MLAVLDHSMKKNRLIDSVMAIYVFPKTNKKPFYSNCCIRSSLEFIG